MTSRRRLALLVLSLAIVTPALAGCGKADRAALEDLRSAMNRTERLAHRFVYTEQTATADVEVEGLVEDDFRYKAQLTFDGKPAYVESVLDDEIAARVLSEAGTKTYGDLGTHDFVLDPIGAPDLVSAENRDLGVDPVLDSLEVFRYIRDVVLRDNVVVKFDREDFAYREAEDPFDKPEEGSGVVRYDVRPWRLPKASDAANGNQIAPGAPNFRKMAVYVKDGLVVRIEEDIDVAGKIDEIERNYDIDFPAGSSIAEKVQIAVDAINAVRRGQGLELMRPRTMRLDLLDLGDDIRVDLPDGIAEGDVSPLKHRGSDDLRPAAAKQS